MQISLPKRATLLATGFAVVIVLAAVAYSDSAPTPPPRDVASGTESTSSAATSTTGAGLRGELSRCLDQRCPDYHWLTYRNPDFGIEFSFPPSIWTLRETVAKDHLTLNLWSNLLVGPSLTIFTPHTADPFAVLLMASSSEPRRVSLNGEHVLLVSPAVQYWGETEVGRAIYHSPTNLLLLTNELPLQNNPAQRAALEEHFSSILGTVRFEHPSTEIGMPN